MTNEVDATEGRSARAVWFTGPRRAELLPAVARPCRPDEVVVQAIASGISQGTETIMYRGEGPKDQPVTPETCEGESMGSFPIKYGYQSVGRVIEAGTASGYAGGELVFARFPHQEVYTVRVDPELLYRLPEHADPVHAVFGNLLDVAVNAMLDVPVRIGDVVVVYGLGVVGSFCAQLAKRTAGRVIAVDPIASRRRLAASFGIDDTVHPDDAPALIAERTGGRGADISIEVSGAPAALQPAIEGTGFEGTVVVVSWYGTKPVTLTLAPAFHMRRQRLVSSQVCAMGSGLAPRWDIARRMEVVWDVLPTLHPDELITHRVPFDEAPRAFDLFDEQPDDVLAVVLTYGDDT